MTKFVKKLILKSNLSPGDIVMLTATVRALHAAFPGEYLTDVRTPCHALWEHNPLITSIADDDPEARVVQMEYPLIHKSNQGPHHFIHAYTQYLSSVLDKHIPCDVFKGDIYLDTSERGWMSQVEEARGLGARFWIIVSGGKRDFTAKWWDAARWQAVVDALPDILFVQVGEASHVHPPLRGVLDLRGKTDLRQLVRLVHHADGVVCPVTSLMHLAAAVPTKSGDLRPCVVVAGGREPSQWEAYPGHRYLDTIGALPCCANGGCWKSRVVPLGDGDEKDKSLCEYPVALYHSSHELPSKSHAGANDASSPENEAPDFKRNKNQPLRTGVRSDGGHDGARVPNAALPGREPAIHDDLSTPRAYLPRCLDLITAEDVVRAVSSYAPAVVEKAVVPIPVQAVKAVAGCAGCGTRDSADPAVWGPKHWRALHARPDMPDALGGEAKWLAAFISALPCAECKTHAAALRVGMGAPDFTDADAYFAWTVNFHNGVNSLLGKPAFSLAEAQLAREKVKNLLVSDEARKARLSVCVQCESFLPATHLAGPTCVETGTLLKPKARLAAEDCPLGKWPRTVKESLTVGTAEELPIKTDSVVAEDSSVTEDHFPDAGKMIGAVETIAICLSVHGGHRKKPIGAIPAADHMEMLEDVVAMLTRAERYPVIVSVVGKWEWSETDPELCRRMQALRDTCIWVESGEDMEHQHGAMQAILQGLQKSEEIGADWMFCAAEDTFFTAPNPAREAIEKAAQFSVDYIGDIFLDEIGIQAVSTQVFAVKTKRLYDSKDSFFPFNHHCFGADFRGLEHYMVQTLINHGVKYLRAMPTPYFHTHHPDEWRQWKRRQKTQSGDLLLRFRHGLGDAAQFTAVLRHLERTRPDAMIDVESKTGTHTAFAGLCRESYDIARAPAGATNYGEVIDIQWSEHEGHAEREMPSTKTVRCLREQFGISAQNFLLKYVINLLPESLSAAIAYLETIGVKLENGRYNVVLLHYQGNTSTERKNLDHSHARAVCNFVIANGFVPMVLDWDHRSPLPNNKSIYCADADNGLWGGHGTGDANRLAALIANCSAMVGIDSGPLHVAATTSTPTIGVWTEHSPCRYFDFSDVLHLVPKNWRQRAPSGSADWMMSAYRLREYSAFIGDAINESLAEALKW